MVAARGRDQQPVDAAGDERGREVALALVVVVRAARERQEAALARAVLDAAVDQREERVRDVLDDDPDAGRDPPGAAQRARRLVALIAEQLDRVAHLRREILPHRGVPVDRPRDRRETHAGQRSDVLHRRSAGASLVHEALTLTQRVGFATMTERGVIVVGGEALVDLVPHAAGELRAHPGGGPYNTARTLGRLEQDVHYLGCLSDDGFGARLRAQLLEDSVRLDTVVETRAADDARAGRARRGRRGHLPLLHRGHLSPGADARGCAGGAPGERRDAARRHARARDGAGRGRARGRRRGGRGHGADHGRPELPAELHRRPRQLSPRPGRHAAPRARGEGQRSTTSSTSSPASSSPPRRARCSRRVRRWRS